MDVEYNAREAPISSLVRFSSESKPSRCSSVPSPEDITWADSCLVNHPEHLNSDWNSVKFALLEILDDKPDLLVSCSDNMDVVPSFEQTNGKEFIDDCFASSHREDSQTMDYGFPDEDDADVFLSEILDGNMNISKTYLQESILPSQNNVIEAKTRNNAFPIIGSSMTNEIELTTKDLKSPAEEEERNEFVKRLKKALAAVSVHSLPSSLGNPIARDDALVDDLISRVRFLSMNRFSG